MQRAGSLHSDPTPTSWLRPEPRSLDQANSAPRSAAHRDIPTTPPRAWASHEPGTRPHQSIAAAQAAGPGTAAGSGPPAAVSEHPLPAPNEHTPPRLSSPLLSPADPGSSCFPEFDTSCNPCKDSLHELRVPMLD